MKGLEASIVKKSYAEGAASTKRLDPEYFQKQHLTDEQLVGTQKSVFSTAKTLGITVDASAFYPSIEEHYGSGDLPFYRVGDVDGVIDEARALRIPSILCEQYPTLKKVLPGDILFTKGGAIDRSGLVKSEGAASRDLIYLNTSTLTETERACLFAYFGTNLFKRMLQRSSSQTAQPHLTITLVRELPIFVGSPTLGEAIGRLINDAYIHLGMSRRGVSDAENFLLESLGLGDWAPPEPLSYSAKASEVFSAGRFDAQYYRPLFSEVHDRLHSTGKAIRLDSILLENSRGRQPNYNELGLPVINSRHVRAHRVTLDNNRKASPDGAIIKIMKGDVLVNGTGVGTIGRSAPYLHDTEALPDNHVTVLRTDAIDPVYLSVFLNSSLGQLQIERHIKGSSGQIELYPNDISQIVIWEAPKEVQTSIRDSILSAFDEEHRADHLLQIARRAVEIAIESGEAASIVYIAQAKISLN